MPFTTFDDVTLGAPLPMDSLLITTAVGTFYEFRHLEAESSWSLDPVTQPTDLGGTRTVAYTFNVKAIILYNNYDGMSAALYDIAENASSFNVRLAGLAGYAARIMSAGVDDPLDEDPVLRSDSLLLGIESIEWRPRLSITCKSILSRDALGPLKRFFKQAGDYDAAKW